MTRLVWDIPEISTGLDRGVLNLRSSGVQVWNGLVEVEESPSDGEVRTAYFDGQKFIQMRSPESFSATISAFSYPEGLADDTFDLSYRVTKESGYELHFIYNIKAILQDNKTNTINPSPELSIFKFDIETIPLSFDGQAMSAHFVLDTSFAYSSAITAIEDVLYGSETIAPQFPQISTIMDIFEEHASFVVVDNGDGTWTATGPDGWFRMLDATTFEITTIAARYLNPQTYRLSSW